VKLLTLVSAIFLFQFSSAQRFNTDAIQEFWKVVDHLKKDRPLTDPLWEAYYSLDGNKKYMDSNRDDEQAQEHRYYLGKVFRPSFPDSLEMLRKMLPSQSNDILLNLLYIHDHEDPLRTYDSVIREPAYMKTCIDLAKRYLPAKTETIPGNLVIYINAMTMDAAVQPPDMYFGLSRVYEYDRFLKGAIAAHEMHHLLRKSRGIERPLSTADSASFDIIDQINNEGGADLIDKTVMVKNADTLYGAKGRISWYMDTAMVTIRRLDSCFRQIASGAPGLVTRSQFRKLTKYSSGHIPGFYMANVIAKNGGMQELISHDENPFYIFYLYNSAAKNDGQHPPSFSEETMAYLHRLEARALKNE
jgi:hypothetical protein